jgi:hypothetical protein
MRSEADCKSAIFDHGVDTSRLAGGFFICIGIMKKFLAVLLSILVMTLAACNKGSEPPAMPVQHWKDMDVRIETHPNPPLAGMSEIVVIVTGPHGKPAQDLIVSLRGNESMPWVQAIQDGFIGVYRRAVDIGDGETAVLQVRFQQGAEQKVLLFPLKLATG